MPCSRRRCLVGTWREGGPTLLLNGRVDVVSEEPADLWTRPAFGAVVDGRAVGRRVRHEGRHRSDAARGRGRARGQDLLGGVVYQSVIEEECGENGTLAACLAGPSADGVVIAEPTNGGIDLVAVGVIWARITIEGESAHASATDEAPIRSRQQRWPSSRLCAVSRPS